MKRYTGNRLRAMSAAQRRRTQRTKQHKVDCRRRIMFLQDFYKDDNE